jgi:hypothetical protein
MQALTVATILSLLIKCSLMCKSTITEGYLPNLYLTTHNIYNRQTSMHPAGFKPAIPASERPQTHALDRAVTGIGKTVATDGNYFKISASLLYHRELCVAA